MDSRRRDHGEVLGLLSCSVDLRGLHFKIIDYGHSSINKEQAVDTEKARKAKDFKSPAIPAVSTEQIYRYRPLEFHLNFGKQLYMTIQLTRGHRPQG
jgi:hypothetical protein